MIKSVKNTVLDRLRQKRFSADSQLQQQSRGDMSPGGDMKQFLRAKKEHEEKEQALQKQIELIEMLERMEDSNPEAYSMFMNEAKRRGIYKTKTVQRSGPKRSQESSLQTRYYNQSPNSLQSNGIELKSELNKSQQA